MPDTSACYVVTGNDTQTGVVVYLRADDTWATALGEAHPFATKPEAEERLAHIRVHEDVVTEPYVFAAELGAEGIRPVSARELLRSQGPSTRLRRPDRSGATA